jgi:methionyl-tRNA formyltransferase
MRIVFIGTGDIGLPSLEALLRSKEHELVAVVTQPDKPVGRSQALTPPHVKTVALEADVPVLQPERIRNFVAELTALQADVFVVAAYGQILSRAVLDVPHVACLNIHASLLPRHRGASPIQAAIREGDIETGITIMWMDEGLDTGDILLQRTLPIAPDDTGGSLHDKLAAQAPDCLAETLQQLEQGARPRVPQDNSQTTHTRKLNREHGRIDWNRSAVELERLIRAYNPWPGTYCFVPIGDGKKLHLKVHHAQVVEHAEACPIGGTVVAGDDRLLVACGSGVLELLEVQLEGRKRMSARDFLRGHAMKAGDRFE